MSDKKFTFTISLNESQLATLRLMAEYANFHTADVVLRKDGREHFFEADWLREMLKIFKGQNLGEALVRINMLNVIITKPEITYRDIVDIAYGKECQLLMTVAWQAGDRMAGGCLAPNDPPIPVTPGMIISAYHTGNA